VETIKFLSDISGDEILFVLNDSGNNSRLLDVPDTHIYILIFHQLSIGKRVRFNFSENDLNTGIRVHTANYLVPKIIG